MCHQSIYKVSTILYFCNGYYVKLCTDIISFSLREYHDISLINIHM